MDSSLDPLAPAQDSGVPGESIMDATRSSPTTQLRELAIDAPPVEPSKTPSPPVSIDGVPSLLDSRRPTKDSSDSSSTPRDSVLATPRGSLNTSPPTSAPPPPTPAPTRAPIYHHRFYQMFTTNRSTVVSAPGKVLMAGGYLVLERKYMGLVVATSSRFYTCIVDMPLEEGLTDINETRESSRTNPPPSKKNPPPEGGRTAPRQLGEQSPGGREKQKMHSAINDKGAALITVRAGQFPFDSATWQYRLELDEAYLPRPPTPPPDDSEDSEESEESEQGEEGEEVEEAEEAEEGDESEEGGEGDGGEDEEPSVLPVETSLGHPNVAESAKPAVESDASPAEASGHSKEITSTSDKRSSKSSLEALLEVEKAAEIPLPPSPSSSDDSQDEPDPAPPAPSNPPAPQIPSMTIVPPSPSQPAHDSRPPPPSPKPRPALHITHINDHSVGPNKFIEIALSRTLELAWEMLCENDLSQAGQMKGGEELLRRLRGTGDGIIIVVLADNDFYSQRPQLVKKRLPLRIESLKKLKPFVSLPQAIHKTAKTGLGSSAALTTSFVAALLQHLNIVELPTPRDPSLDDTPRSPLVTNSLDLVHSLAQLSHCLAQGKVGSGFDVSSAVYGSHQYRRFSPSLLTPLMSVPVTPIILSNLLLHLDPQRWNQQTSRIRLPRGIRLMLADVDAGTDTPSFVSKLLKWREKEPEEAHQIWWRLNRANGMLEECIADLCALEKLDYYDETLEGVSRYLIRQIDREDVIGKQLFRLYNILKVLRGYLQVLTCASRVPVEPIEQTMLLDACQKVPGVIGGGVPGAGGFDAIFLLVIDQPEVVSAVEDVWEDYKDLSVCPLSSRQSDGGLQRESIEKVRGLKKRLEEIVDGA